jgi:hypothetical protein
MTRSKAIGAALAGLLFTACASGHTGPVQGNEGDTREAVRSQSSGTTKTVDDLAPIDFVERTHAIVDLMAANRDDEAIALAVDLYDPNAVIFRELGVNGQGPMGFIDLLRNLRAMYALNVLDICGVFPAPLGDGSYIIHFPNLALLPVPDATGARAAINAVYANEYQIIRGGKIVTHGFVAGDLQNLVGHWEGATAATSAADFITARGACGRTGNAAAEAGLYTWLARWSRLSAAPTPTPPS